MLAQFSYTLMGAYHGFEGPEPRLRTTQTWSNNPKCCGSGTYFPYACEVAVFKYTPQAGGRQDLAIYDPADLKTPILTVKGIWYGPEWLSLSLPGTQEWAPGFIRWGLQDITTTTNKTADGKTQKIGNGLNNGNFGPFHLGLCGIDSWEGPAKAKMPGEILPIGTGTNTPTALFYQNLPYF